MDIKKLDQLAKQNETMPKALAAYEQAYYITSRGLYQQYDKGTIDLKEARKEKAEAIKAYNRGKSQYQLFIELHTIREKLIQLKEEGFNSVLEWELLEAIEKFIHQEE